MTASPKARHSLPPIAPDYSARVEKLTDAILAIIKEADSSYPEAKHALTRALGAIIGSNSKDPDDRAAALSLTYRALDRCTESATLLTRHGLLLDRRASGVRITAPGDHQKIPELPVCSNAGNASELRPRRDKPDIYPDNCITEGDTPHGYWWRYRHPCNASETDMETAIIVAFQIADAEARETGKTYLVARTAGGADAIFVFACDHPDAHNAAINVMFEFTPAGARIRHPGLRTAARH